MVVAVTTPIQKFALNAPMMIRSSATNPPVPGKPAILSAKKAKKNVNFGAFDAMPPRAEIWRAAVL